ncbi:MAG: hypothetical protein KTR24_13515 [Saprospiraceae bacterium]|nr:hypothetical protein [Saprospiraceae bacterium]
MRNSVLIPLTALLILAGCTSDFIQGDQLDITLQNVIKTTSPDRSLDHYILAHSSDLTALPQDPNNPLTTAKVELGSFLFFETGLGTVPRSEVGFQSYSCSSCHVPAADFKPGRMQGIGEGGQGFGYVGEARVKHSAYEEADMDVQGIRPLTVLNVGYSAENTLWNGSFGSKGANEGTEDAWGVFDEATDLNYLGFQGLETQNIEGLRVHRQMMTPELAESLGYIEYFDRAFPNVPVEERYTNQSVSLALSAYLRTLTTTEAPFQKWLKGDMSAMTTQEKRGALVFFDKGNCSSCHSGSAFSATKFFALGVNDLDQSVSFREDEETLKKNKGRGGFTGREEDMFKFKVPTLYNLQGTQFYFHGSSKRSLEEVVEYFDKGLPENDRVPEELIAREFKPLGLTEQEKIDLVAFLRFGLQDNDVIRFKPASLPSNNCFPNADPQSMEELGCN